MARSSNPCHDNYFWGLSFLGSRACVVLFPWKFLLLRPRRKSWEPFSISDAEVGKLLSQRFCDWKRVCDGPFWQKHDRVSSWMHPQTILISMEILGSVAGKNYSIMTMYDWLIAWALQNHDIALKTNQELVKIFKWFNGTNDIGALHAWPAKDLKNDTSWNVGALNLINNGIFLIQLRNWTDSSYQRTTRNSFGIRQELLPGVNPQDNSRVSSHQTKHIGDTHQD